MYFNGRALALAYVRPWVQVLACKQGGKEIGKEKTNGEEEEEVKEKRGGRRNGGRKEGKVATLNKHLKDNGKG